MNRQASSFAFPGRILRCTLRFCVFRFANGGGRGRGADERHGWNRRQQPACREYIRSGVGGAGSTSAGSGGQGGDGGGGAGDNGAGAAGENGQAGRGGSGGSLGTGGSSGSGGTRDGGALLDAGRRDASGSAGSGGSGSSGDSGPSVGVVRSGGCDKPTTQAANQWVQSMVMAGTTSRATWVRLPSNYDPARAYPVIVLLHGCGGGDTCR